MTRGKKPTGPIESTQTKKQGKAILALASQVMERRTSAGLTQQGLSQQAGLGHHGIYRIEKAQVDPKLSTIEGIADVLGTTPAELLK